MMGAGMTVVRCGHAYLTWDRIVVKHHGDLQGQCLVLLGPADWHNNAARWLPTADHNGKHFFNL
jgi:hypothetical protein